MKKKISNMVFVTVLFIAAFILSHGWYESLCQPTWDVWSETPWEVEKRDVPYITVGSGIFAREVAIDELIAQNVYELVSILINVWLLVLILQPIIKCFHLVIQKRKKYEENPDEYEKQKMGLKSIFIRNLILVVIMYMIVGTVNAVSYSLDKPIIYIYPETETTVQVSVGYPEKLSCVYPEYGEDGWEVIAKPNGDLVDTKTGRNLYCLYWEGNQKQEYKFKDGFLVAGKDSAKFLGEKLAILGLNEREANEFIIYWLPKLEVNKYNLIRFETMEEIEEYMPLNIEPKPDTVIRVVMDFKGLNRPIEIAEQKLETPVREGYTVVEWGGSEF